MHLPRMLRPLPDLELQAHFAELLRAARFGIHVLSGFVLICATTDLAFPYPSLLAVLVGFYALNFACGLAARRNVGLDRVIVAQVGGSIVLMTTLIHLFGSTQTGITVAVYVILLLNTAPLLSWPGALLVANVAATAYGAALVAEFADWLPPYTIVGDLPSDWHFAAVLAGGNFVLLNLCVYYARRFGDALEQQSRRLQDANASMRLHADQLETKQRELETVIYGITHDLKTPLNSIALTARAVGARERDRLAPESADDLAWIAGTAQHGEGMLASLLSMFQLTTATEAAQAIDVGELAAEIVAELRPRAGNRTIRIRLDQLPPVWGKPRKLRQALVNVLVNAVDYTSAETGEVTITGAGDAETVTVCVEDNGPGIPEPYHARIFELFGRVPDPERPPCAPCGSGVGLALVQRIVVEHRGEVRVDCPPQGGSRFVITLRTSSPVNGTSRTTTG